MVAKCWRKLCQKGTLYWRKLWNQAIENRAYFQELGERATLNQELLPAALFLQHPLMTKLNIMLAGERKNV